VRRERLLAPGIKFFALERELPSGNSRDSQAIHRTLPEWANSFPDKIIDETRWLPSASCVWYSPAFRRRQRKSAVCEYAVPDSDTPQPDRIRPEQCEHKAGALWT
jgi:hypothetical protein